MPSPRLPRRPLGLFALAALLSLGTALPSSAQSLFPQLESGQRIHVAQQNREAAQLQVQLQDLQEQMRTLTGQVEGLQFQLTQMQTLIQKMQEDYEFRFQELEGGAGGKSDAATQSGGVTPSGALPQDPSTGSNAATAVPELPADEAPMHDDTAGGDQPMDDVGESADPMVGTGAAAGQTVPLAAPDENGRPLDLSLDGGTEISNGDADAQYKAGYDALMRGDYAFAAEQFQQFVQIYPDDPQAPDATNWLGEALIQRGSYDDAALALAEGYKAYEKSPRAPDMLLKLGIALAGAGRQDVACRTFFTLEKRFPNQAEAFMERLRDEKSKAQCPV